jgi:hypothetical protein
VKKEWQAMEREPGVREARGYVKRIDFGLSGMAFDAQFDRSTAPRQMVRGGLLEDCR